MNPTLEQYAQALEERAAQANLRSLRPSRPLTFGRLELAGKKLVNFASNDYLGLSQHPALKARSQEFAMRYGTGSGASRLLSGNLNAYESIENKLAKLKGSEAALILPSGFQANSSIIPTLLSKGSVAAADELVHRSMIEGLLVSSSRWFRYDHINYMDLQQRLGKLEKYHGSRWLFTESVFSMDGDTVDPHELIALAEKLGMALFIDEAHASGVAGQNGMGLFSGHSFPGITMGTFGKGLGSFGAYVCTSKIMKDYLINFCPGLIYSTALPPPVLGAIDAALDLVADLDAEREQLKNNADDLRQALKKIGFDTGRSTTQIIPIIVGSSSAALNLSAFLEENGFYAPAIRPPTVAEGSARLRISLSSVHTKEQIDAFLKALRSWHEKTN